VRIRRLSHGIAVLYEDKEILVVDKPAGLLTVATKHEKMRTAHSILTEYIRTGCGRCRKRLFVVHRLDRDTSGVLIFAKSEEAMYRLKARWKETEKKYLAIVHGSPERKSGTITSYLAENEDYTVCSTMDSTKGRLAQTVYKVVRERKGLSLLEVVTLTGRKNQIRVHLAGIGHSIAGDTKYGKGDDRLPRLALHARSISFKHPFSGKKLSFESEVPDLFIKLFGSVSFIS
jgi:tRNA pseudouridine32 synthase/23S rRNA pseudouridine746 synthase/23S rRNA pseudouridine1911/1915/1917 synthase